MSVLPLAGVTPVVFVLSTCMLLLFSIQRTEQGNVLARYGCSNGLVGICFIMDLQSFQLKLCGSRCNIIYVFVGSCIKFN